MLAISFALVAYPSQAETVLSLYGGVQGVRESPITDAGGEQTVLWEGRSLSAPPYYGLRLTFWRNNSLGYGLDVNHAKAYADDPTNYGYDRLEFSDGLNIVTLNLWRRFAPGPWGLIPYVGIGAGVAIPHVDITPSGGVHTFGYQLTGPALQTVLGLRHDLSERWAVFGELKATWSRHEVDLEGGGHLETRLTTGAINIGLDWKF